MLEGNVDAPSIIAQIQFNTAADVAKVLKGLSPSVPVCLYCRPKRNRSTTVLVCYSPVDMKVFIS